MLLWRHETTYHCGFRIDDLGLQDAIRRSEESRYHHRLHGVLLVAEGLTCPAVARLLGDAPRTVEYWVKASAQGPGRAAGGRKTGRPRRLSNERMRQIEVVLRRTPREAGLGGNIWDGKTLRHVDRKGVWRQSGRTSVPAHVSPTGFPVA